jgi:hypothetical protein
VFLASFLPIACGGSNASPPPETFTITVTATSGSLSHTTRCLTRGSVRSANEALTAGRKLPG